MSDPRVDPLRRALRELAEADAADVLSEARARARARAAKVIEDQLLDQLLEAAGRGTAPARRDRDAAPMASRDSDPASVARTRHHAPTQPHPSTVQREPSSAEAWWTYCVLSSADAAGVPPGLEGVEPGTSVEVVVEGELAALISAVPADEYDDVRLREHLEDLGWVERTARRHEAVLEGTLASVTIVPLRLCTLYRDLGGVRRLLAENAESLRASLLEVEGCAEWGVKVFAGEGVERIEESDPGEDEPDGPSSERPGATYLIERRRERERAEQAADLRRHCAETVHDRVSACAHRSISNPPQHPELHGRNMTMLLNGAYLIAREQEAELREVVSALEAEWRPRGFVIELTGPWPAYNFVSGVMP